MTPWVLRLVIANVVVFLLTAAAPAWASQLALVPAAVLAHPWTAVTYMFVHAGMLHLLFNIMGLYFFGPRMEERLGSGGFLGLYVVSGIAGAILTFVLAPYAAVVGASGAVMGVLAGYARYWPEDRIYIWGVLPVSARMMVIGLAAYSIWSGFMASGGGVAHFAHLGGLLAGWLYVLAWERRRRGAWPPARKAARVAPSQARARAERWARIKPEQLHEVNRAEVERLLTRVREEGPRSLTPAEADFLDRFTPA